MAEERSNEFHNVVPLQIRFNDVDKFGHVNNTIYFQFYDSGKTDYVSTVCKGFDWDRYAIFVVKIEVEFFAQIKGSDRIAVRTRTAKLGNKSFHLEQEIFDTDTQEVKSRCLSILVLYDLEQKHSIPFSDEIVMLLPTFLDVSLSDYNSRSAGGYHEHRAVSSDRFIVDVDAYDGIGSHCLGTLHHLLHGGILGFGKHFLISTCTTTYDVADASKQILEHVSTDNSFTCHNTFVLTDGVTFNLWSC